MIGYEVKEDLRLVKVKRLLGLPIYEKNAPTVGWNAPF